MYQPEKWVPRPKTVDVFLISLENLQDIKTLLGATSVRSAYHRDRTVLIEWTMMHRETFAGLVGQYIVRNDRGEFEVLDRDDLRADYQPFVEEINRGKDTVLNHPELGRLLAVNREEDTIIEVLFELPDGTPATFILPKEVEIEVEPPEYTTVENVDDVTFEVPQEVKDESEEEPAPTPTPKVPSPAEIYRKSKQENNNSNEEKN